MEINFKDKEIAIEKELTSLDKFVISFVDILEKNKVKYVIISGYIAILFGRTRHTEDIDAFMEHLNKDKFKLLWDDLAKDYECLNTNDPDEAYEYLDENVSLRFAEKGTIMPNFELKFPKSQLDNFALASRVLVRINKHSFYTSGIEMQIAFKLYLGSEKDLEDAKHLWLIFKPYLNKETFKYFTHLLGIRNQGVLNGL